MRLLALLLLLLTALASPAGAGQEDARRAVRSGEARPLGEILSGLSRRYPGRVLDADIAERGDGDWTYGIRLLDPRGRVVELDVDARSGRVLRERGGGDGGSPGFAPQGGGAWNGFRDPGGARPERGDRDWTDRGRSFGDRNSDRRGPDRGGPDRRGADSRGADGRGPDRRAPDFREDDRRRSFGDRRDDDRRGWGRGSERRGYERQGFERREERPSGFGDRRDDRRYDRRDERRYEGRGRGRNDDRGRGRGRDRD